MDLQTINQELNKRFAEPLPEFYKRRIVIWKDEEGEFDEAVALVFRAPQSWSLFPLD